MVCDGPDPPENDADDIIPPPRHELLLNGNDDDSDDDRNENFGYEPLPQGPDGLQQEHSDSDEDVEVPISQPASDLPGIETMDAALTREVWNAPHTSQSIEMNIEHAQQVMSAMANFTLPQSSIPEWAQSVSEEQWKQTLKDKIEMLRGNR